VENNAASALGGWKSTLREGLDAAKAKLEELEGHETYGASVTQSRRLATSGGKTVVAVYGKTASVVTQEEAWAETQALLEELVDIVAIQQGMIEQLRERVVELERR